MYGRQFLSMGNEGHGVADMASPTYIAQQLARMEAAAREAARRLEELRVTTTGTVTPNDDVQQIAERNDTAMVRPCWVPSSQTK